MIEAHPELSIVITSYNARETVARCIESIRQQRTTHHFEIILVDSSSDDTAGIVRDHYPEVQLITSPFRLYCGDARNVGLTAAQADLIAFLDADCYVDADWVNAILKAHRGESLLVGGIIDNAPKLDMVSWAYYFCEFSLWLPARRPRRIKEMAGCCLSFKRAAYDQYGPFIEGTYCSDTAFQWRLQKNGHDVLFDPAIRVCHNSSSRLGSFLSHVFEHRRHFARVKCQEKGLSVMRRLTEIVLLPITPMLLMGATLLRLRRCWRYFPYFLLSAPLLFMGYCIRCCGELTGYLSYRRSSTLS